MNWVNYDFSPAPCLPCCVLPVSACELTMPTLLIDGTTTNYSNLASATAAITAQAASGCLTEYVLGEPSYQTLNSISSSVTSSILTFQAIITGTTDLSGGSVSSGSCLERVHVTAAGGINVFQNLTTNHGGLPDVNRSVNVTIYADDGTTIVDSGISGDTPFTNYASGTFNLTVPTDGFYYVHTTWQAQTTFASIQGTMDSTISSGGTITFCTIRAAYDDGSGGTAYVVCT